MRIFASLMPVKDDDIAHLVGILNHCIDGFHIDIMDGKFVAHVYGSVEHISYIRSLSNLPLWIHLMVSDPLVLVNRLSLKQGDIVSIHYESCRGMPEIIEVLGDIQEKGARASLAINPDTPVECVVPYVPYLDQVLLMGVAPGKSGQTMVAATKDRMQKLHQLRMDTQAQFTIGLDGGITQHSLTELSPYLPDECAAASSIVQAADPCEAVANLRSCV